MLSALKQEQGNIFTADEFKAMFRKLEKEDNVKAVSFPFGNIFGDVEDMLLYLLNESLIKDEGYGRYRHVDAS